jgi:hypothetical protein
VTGRGAVGRAAVVVFFWVRCYFWGRSLIAVFLAFVCAILGHAANGFATFPGRCSTEFTFLGPTRCCCLTLPGFIGGPLGFDSYTASFDSYLQICFCLKLSKERPRLCLYKSVGSFHLVTSFPASLSKLPLPEFGRARIVPGRHPSFPLQSRRRISYGIF